MDKSKLLDQCGALGEDRTLLARVLDRAKQASERNISAATDFLSPAQQAQAADLLHATGIPETAYIRWGGYDGADPLMVSSLEGTPLEYQYDSYTEFLQDKYQTSMTILLLTNIKIQTGCKMS